MKLVKFNKSLLKKDWDEILEHFGAVDRANNEAYPFHVYMSKEDIKEVRRNCRAKYKKKYSYMNKKYLDLSEGMEFLNLGANSSLEDAIKPGYALVDTEAFKIEYNE